jgi:hypothetical protein
VTGSTRGINGMGMVMQQTGYQVGDFLVQVQSGTNFMVAFGQQATQLVGILPMLGAGFMGLSMKSLVALSAGLGIAIPLMTAIGAAFMRTRQSAEESSESIETLEERLKSLDNTLREYLRTREAARMGITAEELLGLEGLEDAEENLRRLRSEFENIRRAGTASIITGGGGFAFFSRRASAEEEEALRKLIEAENRVATLRQKQGEEQFRTFSERLAQYQEEIKLQETIAKFGESSEEARQVRLEQAIEAEQDRIESQRESGEITIAQAIALKASAEESIRLAESTRRQTEEQERQLELQQRQDALITDRTSSLENQTRLAETILSFGEDSAEVEAERARQAREAYLLEIMRNGIYGEQLTNLIALYDEHARINEILSRPVQGPNLPTTPPRTPRASGGAGGQDPLQQLQQRLKLEQDLLGKTEAQRRVIQALGVNWRNYDESAVAALIATAEQLDNTNRKIAEQQSIADTIKDSMGDAFMSMVDGTKTVEDAFKDMARSIIKQLYDVLVVQRLVGSFNATSKTGSGIVGAIGSALFRESGGSMMANRPYIVGERGPELVIPGRSATVSNADLTRKAMGGSDGVVVNQTINVNGGTDPAAIRQEVAKLMPQITNATKSAVIDARRRGGQMKAAFG